jgi:uncharacterized membrane protein (DUF485 family)
MSVPPQDPPAVPGAESADPNVFWSEATRLPSYRELISAKTRLLVPMIIFYLGFYVTITLLAGFASGFMARQVVGSVSIGFLLVLATYVVIWIIALVYVRVANRSFDPKAKKAIDDLDARTLKDSE